ncbi:MAG: fumarylacetoacetate hydrolase family protein [Anaerolineales bacterium]|nr:fumarylacetoacetate hydrolase family protein [Anaerolineales bacterium]
MDDQKINELAQQLDNAWENRQPIAPLRDSAGLADVIDSYAIQTRWTEMRLERGETIIGRKIGLTSKAVQQQMGVDEPDYGTLWGSRYFAAAHGRAEVPVDLFLQPRIEGEIAFLMGRDVRGPHVTPQEVLAATEAIALSAEIVDSRIENWRIKLVDTVADNASYGGFSIGAWDHQLTETDLRLLGLLITKNGEPAAQGIGAAALGHPALAVAWLANKLSSFDITLKAGDIVLSGAVAPTLPAVPGDVFTLEMLGQPPLTVMFT